MSGFFVLDYLGGARGCPPFVEASIDEFKAAPWNDNQPASVAIYRDPQPLHMRTKLRVVDFDYARVHSVFVCSQAFLDRLDGMDCRYDKRPLRVFEGRNENTRKPYFVLRLADRLFAMDAARSSFQVMREPKTRAVKPHPLDPTKPAVNNVYTLVIDPAATGGSDLFWCCEALANIVSARLAERVSGLLGVRLTPTDEYEFPMTGARRIVDKG